VRLDVTRGQALARLEGGLAMPRTVSVRLAPLSDREWERVLAALAAEARYSAQLLAGEMPDDVEAVFEAAGTSLLPRTNAGFGLACTCSEARRGLGPCKHAAAVCYVLAERLDADPFLLFELRGRTRHQISASLRARRTIGALHAAPSPAVHIPAGDAADDAPGVPAGFFSCPGGGPDLEALEALVATPGPAPVRDAAAVLQLGPPPFWPDRDAFAAAMAKAYRTIGERATLT
jgi:uncharacterized Zn finger protein